MHSCSLKPVLQRNKKLLKQAVCMQHENALVVAILNLARSLQLMKFDVV